jgi:O-antigen ligase
MLALSGPIVQRAFGSKNDSTVAREIYKADAREMIADSPWVGHGLNSYTLELPNYTGLSLQLYGATLPAVHNIYYLWWAETGIGGLILFLSIWGAFIWNGIQNLRVSDPHLFVVNAACVAAMVCLIPDGFLSYTVRVNTMFRVFWVMGGLIYAVRYIRIAGPRPAPTFPLAAALEPEPDVLQPAGG